MRLFIINLVVFISCAFSANAQVYDLLNDIFEDKKKDSIYVFENFKSFNDPNFNRRVLEYDFIRRGWDRMETEETDDMVLFFKSFDLDKIFICNDSLIESKNVNFKELNSNIYIFEKSQKIIPSKSYADLKSYYLIYHPIFNCKKDWAIVSLDRVYNVDIGISGSILIYRKIDDKWVFYHEIIIWIS